MIYFDAHVHIQKNWTLEHLLSCARANFSNVFKENSQGRPGTFFLLLSEVSNCDIFSNLKAQAEKDHGYNEGRWRISSTREAESLLAIHIDRPKERLFLLAGRQIVTAERLEVLALATCMKLADGRSLSETVAAIRGQEGLAVLPWGAGKWLGKRGKAVGVFLNTALPDRLFVGDNGGRPSIWPTPTQFTIAAERGIRLLPGTDPLPLAGEEKRVGSYGGILQGECSTDHPASDLRSLLTASNAKITAFGRRLTVVRFLKSQIALRLQ